MRKLSLLVLAAIVVVGFSPAPSAHGWSHGAVRQTGSFPVDVDFATLRLDPLGPHCLLRVDVTLDFTGTLTGTATGTTTALVFASCTEVANGGTARDVFRSDLTYRGDDGTEATITYAGTTAVGGAIRAVMAFRGDLVGALHVDASLALGGTYKGRLVERR